MPTGQGMDRTGALSPEEVIGFTHPKVNRIIGGMPDAVALVGSTTDLKTMFRSELIPADRWALGCQYKFSVMGLISASANDNFTFDINLIEPDETRNIILATTTVALATENIKVFEFTSQGIVVLEQDGSTSGKIAATSKLRVEQGSPLVFVGQTAIAGVEIDFRGLTLLPDGVNYQKNGVHFELTCTWDDTDGDNEVEIFGAMLHLSNARGGGGFVA